MILTIRELNEQAKALLNINFSDIEVRGEILKITHHTSGHWYFTLTDEKQEHSINCVMFRGNNRFCKFRPEVGQKIIAQGMVDLYVSNGSYQLGVKKLSLDGEGELERYLAKLREKLQKEGLFNKEFKKELPKFPKKIAIITSTTSAAYEDIKKTIKNRWGLCKFEIYNSLMQGETCVNSIISSLNRADKMGYDIIIITRGGGSREDLWSFNDETLARAVFSAKTPIVSAIGHESDFTVLDDVSDFRSSTPTASIVDTLPDKNRFLQHLDSKKEQFMQVMDKKIDTLSSKFELLKYKMRSHSLNDKITTLQNSLANLKSNLNLVVNNKILRFELKIKEFRAVFNSKKEFLDRSANFIQIQKDGKITNLKDLKNGDEITLISTSLTKEAIIK